MGEIEQMNKREKLFSFPDGERSRNGVPDFADFSLDSGLKKDLLQMIQKKCFRQLADSDWKRSMRRVCPAQWKIWTGTRTIPCAEECKSHGAAAQNGKHPPPEGRILFFRHSKTARGCGNFTPLRPSAGV